MRYLLFNEVYLFHDLISIVQFFKLTPVFRLD